MNTSQNQNINTNPSLCIPRVDLHFTKEKIYDIFQKLNFGKLDRVDVVHKKTLKREEYKCIFIHFKYWYNNENSEKIKERMLLKNDIKIIYEFPWFWKIYINKF